VQFPSALINFIIGFSATRTAVTELAIRNFAQVAFRLVMQRFVPFSLMVVQSQVISSKMAQKHYFFASVGAVEDHHQVFIRFSS
jgi:hypothetical protein